MRTLVVLMWKHLMVRKRRYIHTTVEICTPLVFFGLLFVFREGFQPPSQIVPGQPNRTYDYREQLPDVRPLSSITVPRKVFYYPQNALTDELMDVVGRKLELPRLTIMPRAYTIYKGFYGIRNLTEISAYMDDMGHDEAYIVFENINEEGWPAHLYYSIRMKNAFYTNTYESVDKMTKPHRHYGEMYDEFVRLQWTIDTSYIAVTTGTNVTQEVSLQEFPYYGNYVNQQMIILCYLCYLFSVISLMISFVFQMQRLLEEKATGIQELIKMVGVSSNALGISHFLNVLPVGIIFSAGTTLLLKSSSMALIPNSNGFIMFLMFLLHFISVVSTAFACSYLVKNTQYVTSVSVFAYIALLIPSWVLRRFTIPSTFLILSGILPHAPISWYWTEVMTFELFGEGLGWSGAMTSHSEMSGPVAMALLWLVVQSLVFFFIAWYLSKVAPGKYGLAQPWNFLCQKQFWSKNEVKPTHIADEEVLIERDERYFEAQPKHLDVGIKINDVSKMFPKHKALSNVNLNVYKGEITVLLGHNGAGKTTLMNIITGMLAPTTGQVFVNGEDITRNRGKVSKQIGLCPQHNLFFPDLTVLEHVMFFTLLKSGDREAVRSASLGLLSRLGLGDKAESRAAELSGGMKRRLQLAIALAGNADVLVLDEPTAGLDVETRRELWDLLLSLRGSRAVLLSTHFMEEADALGDRVAALHGGRLRCHATTMHLKSAIGTGYRLHLTTSSAPRDADITSVVTSKVPEATLIQKTINTLTYNLPATSIKKFSSLFSALEGKKTQLEIESIGVGLSTLEEVFLKLCSDTDFNKLDDQVDGTLHEPTFNKITGCKLYMRQFCVLWKRHFNFLMSKKISFAILQIILPILMIFLFTSTSNKTGNAEDPNQKLSADLDMYERRSDAKVLYNIQNKEIVERLKRDYPNIEFVEATDVSEAILRTGKIDTMEYNKYVVGIELSDTEAKVLYTTVVRHAAAAAMNLLTNALSSLAVGGDSARLITTYNHPIPSARAAAGEAALDDGLVEPKPSEILVVWVFFMAFIIMATLSNLASLPCRERLSGTRHIHLLCGCPSVVHWAATTTFHVALTLLTLVLATVLAAVLLDKDQTINTPDFIGCLILMLTLGTFAYLAAMYLVSFMFGERGTAVILIGCLVIFGLITPAIAETISTESAAATYPVTSALMEVCVWLTPPHALMLGLDAGAAVARLNAYCTLNRARCPSLLIMEYGFDAAACCAGKAPRCYYCWDEFSPVPYMLALVFQFFLYMTLVILTQEGYMCRLKERVVSAAYRPPAPPAEDDAVRAEREFVETYDKSQLPNSDIAMLVQNLHKNYSSISKRVNAAKGISFSVKKGECFGLLGVNGAGKSTTFKMITAEECPTRGTIYANGYHLDKDRKKYMQTLGYCPQFFGLDSFQTGRANLELLLTLRGLDANDVRNEVKTWLEIVGLEKFAGRSVSGYSGGMCRRLGAAAALGCGGRAALLDEPTAGVDVAARRRVWAALRVRLHARPVLLSSHSMDEMEALCDRVAILAGGRVRALGSPHELRASHARGHAVTLKLRSRPPDIAPAPAAGTDEVDAAVKDNVNKLKTTLHKKFNCTLKDEHKTMLHYHINETMKYSTLFAELEALKAAYPTLVEDYSVTETTLEEVFLSFAKEQHDENNPWAKNRDTNNIV